MDQKKIRALIGFLRDLRAPLKLLPMLLSIVLTIIRRITEQDKTPGVKVLKQGFLCRKSAQTPAGCASPCVTECPDGSFAAAFAYATVENSQIITRICVTRSKDSEGLGFSTRQTVYETCLSPENMTITDTVHGLFLTWDNRGGRSFAAPQTFGKAVVEAMRQHTAALREAACDDLGWHCALIPKDGEKAIEPHKIAIHAAQPPIKLDDNELLFVTAQDGKAVVTRCILPTCRTQAVSTIALPQEEGLVCLEATAAKLKNGRLAAVLNLSGELYYAFSDDMGARWSRCTPMKIKASAPNLCVRTDGTAALSYLVPRKTLSIHACTSPDGEQDWSEERTVVAAPAADFYRPVTTGCGDAFLTVSRQRYGADRTPSALLTRWADADRAENEESAEGGDPADKAEPAE